MKRIQITRDCEAPTQPREGQAEQHRLEMGMILYLLHDDEGDNYNAALGGQPILVPKSCAVVVAEGVPRAYVASVDAKPPKPDPEPTTRQPEQAGRTEAPDNERAETAAMPAAPASAPAPRAAGRQEQTGAQSGDVLRQVDRGPLIAGALALIIAFSTSQTWARAFVFAIDGTDTDRGIIALIAALGAAAVCGWRAFLGLRAGWYFGACLALGILAFAMSFWFLAEVLSEPSTELFGSEVRILTASWALYFTAITSAAFLISIFAQMVTARGPSRRQPFPPPERSDSW